MALSGWRPQRRISVSEVLTECSASIHSLAVSPDGRWLIAGQANGEALLWELPARRPKARWQFGSKVNCLAFSPDNRLLAVGCQDGAVWVLENPTGERITQFRRADRTSYNLRFSTDNKRLAICSDGSFTIGDCETKAFQRVKQEHRAWRAAVSGFPIHRSRDAAGRASLLLWGLI